MKAHILIVEDDPAARITFAHLLQHDGYQVTQAPDGEAAIDLLEQGTFEVVVADIIMGTIDGIEVLHTAHLQPYRPNVILITGHGTLETAIAAVRMGAYEYLLKPASRNDLLQSVARAVQDYRDDHEIRQAAALIKQIYERRHSGQKGGSAAVPHAFSHGAHGAPPAAGPGPVPDQVFQIGNLEIGKTRHDVLFRGQPISLTPIEHALLQFLAETPGETRSYQDIVRRTHRFEAEENDAQALVRQHIRNLRKKLDMRYLVNDRGTGYKIVDPGDEETEA
jgi:DNA-binding response OmpR family regulator